jgi:zinc transport system permease protein
MHLLDPLAYDFIRHALVAGLLASLLCSIVGTFVVVKKLVFVSGGISHAAFGGVGLAYLLGVDTRLGAALVAALAALYLTGRTEGRGRSHDARIGVLWAVGMAVGMVCLSRTPGYNPDLVAYLFGDILAIRTSDLWALASLTLIALLFFVWRYRELVATAFDPSYAAVQGVAVHRLNTFLMLLVALTVVVLIQVVGIILVIALLTVPPLIGLRLAKSFLGVVVIAAIAGAAITLLGLAGSYAWDLPSGPAIVLLGAAILALTQMVDRWWLSRSRS